MVRCVCSTIHLVFYSLEAERLLDPNEIDVFVLHCVFLPKIQCALDRFLNAWNNHPVGTERNLRPKRLWFSSLFEPLGSISISCSS